MRLWLPTLSTGGMYQERKQVTIIEIGVKIESLWHDYNISFFLKEFCVNNFYFKVLNTCLEPKVWNPVKIYENVKRHG